ncbi:hypothetical protein B9T33_11385 [Acinetobacter sp. ANC 5054]|uniref:hypothetical protein n=1 Tax=Acinetobacter sp. ANC 5054 TaxID=1977877 RepID=UPI000A358C16|nr:hypothetical protein [Acinetobacter sp. ANC 5054]OTG79733.1 hypothetical protein B9T33_11385 [Acinetobacter sp. ANC 5054]
MTAYTSVMKASQYEDDLIPNLAIHAFRHAFEQASATSAVVYVKGQQLVQRLQNGQEIQLKDVSSDFVQFDSIPQILKRKKKIEETV